MKHVYLKTPEAKELYYRQIWMMDPETMSYNAGYDREMDGYDKASGTICKTDEQLWEWYEKWTKSPNRYFAYIYDADLEIPVGEIYYQDYENENEFGIGIVIASRYRGKGYGYPALVNLEKIAFEEKGAKALSDWFPEKRIEAVRLFQKAGFLPTNIRRKELVFGQEKETVKYLLTKEQYEQRKMEAGDKEKSL